MIVKYHHIEHNSKKYLIQTIQTEKEIIVIIQYENINELGNLALSQKTIEEIPSTTIIYGDIFDEESMSIAQILSMKLNKRVTVSCTVEFDQFDNSKIFITQQMIKQLTQ